MRFSPMAEFPLCEYEARVSRLVELLKEKGLDGIMVSNRENTRYYTDLQSVIWPSKVSTPGILLVNTKGETAMIGSASAVETARYTCVLDPEDVTCYNRNALPGIPSTYPDAIVEAFKRLGMDKGKVGMEFGEGMYLQLQWHWYEDLCRLMPDAEFVDAADIIMAQRTVKSAAEIDMLRTACHQSEVSLEYAFKNTVPGKTTEVEFFRLYAQEAFRNHCENVTNDFAQMSVRYGSERFPLVACPCSDNVIGDARNSCLIASGGLYTHGYYTHLTRTAFIGGMTEQQRALQAIADKAAGLALENIRAGASVKAVTDMVDEYVMSTEAAPLYLSKGDLGFGVGMDLKEPPYLRTAAVNGGTFKAGMVLSVCVRIGSAELGLMASSYELTVTQDGVELLSDKDPKPVIL